MAIIVESITALLLGGSIGIGFGLLQQAALRRHQEQEQRGNFKSGWTLLPGSGGRVALLLLTLALAQVVCPMLFASGIQWSVSGGVVAGYGWMLFRQFRQRKNRDARAPN